jgi:ferredoxin--NADP+ reductase
VEFGSDLSLADIHRHYHAVIFSVGASSDRSLGIPGEDLPGSLSATEFVAWYNGHPDYADIDPPLDAKRVVVIGMGNVAVDVTRILAKSTEELAETDIADHALDKLAQSQVEEIVMLGRRGPAQGKFTTKELRELGELANADIEVDAGAIELDEHSREAIADDPYTKKNVEVLEGFAAQEKKGKPRKVVLRFFASPVELQGDDRVERVVIEENRLAPTDGGYLEAVGTGETEVLTAGMVLRSVGYRGVPLPDLPFDPRRGVIPTDAGRVLDGPGGQPRLGEYVAGWIKRGPSGVIGTNKADALETVNTLLEDPLPAIDPEDATPEAVTDLLAKRNVPYVTFDAWLELDRHEVELGERQGRPRVKVTSLSGMLEVAEGTSER